jgi:hypothetical protein
MGGDDQAASGAGVPSVLHAGYRILTIKAPPTGGQP